MIGVCSVRYVCGLRSLLAKTHYLPTHRNWTDVGYGPWMTASFVFG